MKITRCLSRTKGGILMIRFRNTISDMNVLIENFKKMYVDFSNMDYFDLDNIAEFFAREQLASSSGYIGDEALRRSYLIKDDSRKSMKMQAFVIFWGRFANYFLLNGSPQNKLGFFDSPSSIVF